MKIYTLPKWGKGKVYSIFKKFNYYNLYNNYSKFTNVKFCFFYTNKNQLRFLGYNQKKSYKETLSTEEYNKVRKTTCPYLVKGERDAKKLADLKSIVVKGKDCADKLDTAYVRGMMNGIIDRSGSTYNTLTSLEGWKNILSGGCILLYNIALCANPAAPMSPECLEFLTALVEAGKTYTEGLLQDDCYKRGYAWGEMIVDALAIKGLEALATGTIKIAGRVIKATTVETKLVPVIKSTVGLGFVSSLSNNLLKFGIKLGGKTLKTWSFITLLNIEIFRYSLNNGRFVFANSLRTTATSTILYTIRDIHYATDVNPSIKFATIEIVKDAAGKVAWRELAAEGAGRLFKVGDNIAGKAIQKVRTGTNGKVAVIGRRMPGHVEDVTAELTRQGKQVEAFNDTYQAGKSFNLDGRNYTWEQIKLDFSNTNGKYLTNSQGYIIDSKIPNTLMYKANQQWASKLVSQGYEVIDIGYPAGQNLGASLFYNMELLTIFP